MAAAMGQLLTVDWMELRQCRNRRTCCAPAPLHLRPVHVTSLTRGCSHAALNDQNIGFVLLLALVHVGTCC